MAPMPRTQRVYKELAIGQSDPITSLRRAKVGSGHWRKSTNFTNVLKFYFS